MVIELLYFTNVFFFIPILMFIPSAFSRRDSRNQTSQNSKIG